ncbi:excalibur calcium-binding domain-containing protein [Streptomyces sp. NPDC001928]|uniref:excalibur calcium-binding domain-containing protein n=1 Tax=Streptomyces sp. NPDC001928 TaxID=3154404 RepID=UPI003323EE81
MTNPYTTPPMPGQPGQSVRPGPKWARKRYVLPALGLAFFVGLGAGGASGEDAKNIEAKPKAASPQPTVTITTTTTAPAEEPEPAPTVTATKTIRATTTVTAAPAADSGSASDDDSSAGDVYYANCSEARAAGAAPVHRGEPGYASHLDRDNDGVGCDS